jgi:GT2 family glycosyltransferase
VPVVDVVVVCWNDRDKIAVALDSVFALPEVKYDRGFARVVVSDNGSTDGSRRYLRERYGDRLTIVENGEIAGSRIYNLDGTIQESCGEFDTWAGAFLRSSAWGEWPIFATFANGKKLRDWGHAGERRVDIAIGAALCVRRRLIHDIGPFDERFFLYHEEVDFAKRAADAGWETWYVPSSEAVHEGMGSARGSYNVETRKQTSRRKYWLKHYGRLWYAALVAALIGRYLLYALALVSGIVAMRCIFVSRLR